MPTVADDLVDTGADTSREAVVPERRGIRVPLHTKVVDYPVELERRDTRPNVGRRDVKNFASELTQSFNRCQDLDEGVKTYRTDRPHAFDLMGLQHSSDSYTFYCLFRTRSALDDCEHEWSQHSWDTHHLEAVASDREDVFGALEGELTILRIIGCAGRWQWSAKAIRACNDPTKDSARSGICSGIVRCGTASNG